MKKCTQCGGIKPVSEFYNDKKTADGLRSQCSACIRESVKKYYWENREKILLGKQRKQSK